MIFKNYTFPYGSSFEVDPLIGVETEHGWIKQRMCNFTDLYIIENSEGEETVIDTKYARFYLDEETLGNIEEYAKTHLSKFLTELGLPITIYKSLIGK